MQHLINIGVDPKPGHLFQDWQQAEVFLLQNGLNGFEIAPHGNFNSSLLPKALVKGLHLTFFPILLPFWQQDAQALLSIFGDWQTVEQYYGGLEPQCLVDTYVHQLNMAQDLNVPYVVFHPVSCDMDHLFDFAFPWQLQETLNASAELINAALKQSHFKGKLLFENLWWPSSFRLDSRDEYDQLRKLVNYDNCGLCFDTGHMMATNTKLLNEAQGVKFLLHKLMQLDLCHEIETLHLNANLNGDYIETAMQKRQPYQDCDDFWQKLAVALNHVSQIDSHTPFVQTPLDSLIELINPNHIVHELGQTSLAHWQKAICSQKSLVTLC
ncbi:TIM barrel protein [Shewanella algicola]|uniref:TIM barrel protein n=1 Tax=Shewanella algicola TaxID=640633 RepID=UPI002495546A|nr:TIM barrel protein [Shewanella algicola]